MNERVSFLPLLCIPQSILCVDETHFLKHRLDHIISLLHMLPCLPVTHRKSPTCYMVSTVCHVPAPPLCHLLSPSTSNSPGLTHPTWQPRAMTMDSLNMPCSFCPQLFHGCCFLTLQWAPSFDCWANAEELSLLHPPASLVPYCTLHNFCDRSQTLAECRV